MDLNYFITNFLVQALIFLIIGFTLSQENNSKKFIGYLSFIMVLYQLIIAILINENIIKIKQNQNQK